MDQYTPLVQDVLDPARNVSFVVEVVESVQPYALVHEGVVVVTRGDCTLADPDVTPVNENCCGPTPVGIQLNVRTFELMDAPETVSPVFGATIVGITVAA